MASSESSDCEDQLTFLQGQSDQVFIDQNVVTEAEAAALNIEALTYHNLDEAWKQKYREAALYLEEGERQDTDSHPNDKTAMKFYFIAKNKWFNVMLLLTSILNLSLALVEEPGKPLFYCPIPLHIAIEVCCLLFFTVEQVFHFIWLGKNGFLRNSRSLLSSIAIVVLLVECVVYHASGSMHNRYCRILRSFFFLSNYYTKPMRRFMSEYFWSLGPIIRMLLLILLHVLFFSLLGCNLFYYHNPFFRTIKDSFVSLFVLLTTANYPDVMMPSYARHPIAVFFFVAYIAIGIYLLMNLLFAVVYNRFSDLQLELLKTIYLHRRKCAEKAFNLLTKPENPCRVEFPQFEGFMHQYRPGQTTMDIYKTFKALDNDNSGAIGLTEFYSLYEVSHYKWQKMCHGNKRLWWKKSKNRCFKGFMSRLTRLLSSRLFTYFIYAVIILNTISLFISLIHSAENPIVVTLQYFGFDIELVCSIIYVVESLLKIAAFGAKIYFKKAWNVYDFVISWAAFIGQLVELFWRRSQYIAIIRPLRLLRLLEADDFYRHILATCLATLPIFGTMVVVVLVVYYSYGIIAIGLFADAPLENCCSGSAVAAYYQKDNITDGYYYANSFDNILCAFVTLFELTVINNWFVIMDAYSLVYSEWARLFFMLFYLQMMILTNMVLSYVLGSFMFRMQYKKHAVGDATTDLYYVYETVFVNKHEEAQIYLHNNLYASNVNKARIRRYTEEDDFKDLKLHELAALDIKRCEYQGVRRKEQFELNMEMHENDLKSWIREENFVNNLRSFLRRSNTDTKNIVNTAEQQQQQQQPAKTKPPAWATRVYWRRRGKSLRTYATWSYWMEDPDAEKTEAPLNSATEKAAETDTKVKPQQHTDDDTAPAIDSAVDETDCIEMKVSTQLQSLPPSVYTRNSQGSSRPPSQLQSQSSQPRKEPRLMTVLINAMKAAQSEKLPEHQ